MKFRLDSALIALILAFVSWYVVTGREKAESWVNVRLEMTGLAEGLSLRQDLPASVSALVRGSRGALKRLDLEPPAYALELHGLPAGHYSLEMRTDKIDLPKVFEVAEFRPPRLVIDIDRRVQVSLPVEPRLANGSPKGVSAKDIVLEPSQVRATGPEGLLRDLRSVKTQPILLAGLDLSQAEGVVAVEAPPGVDLNPRTVRFSIRPKDAR